LSQACSFGTASQFRQNLTGPRAADLRQRRHRAERAAVLGQELWAPPADHLLSVAASIAVLRVLFQDKATERLFGIACQLNGMANVRSARRTPPIAALMDRLKKARASRDEYNKENRSFILWEVPMPHAIDWMYHRKG
jgi:hypothetical protein